MEKRMEKPQTNASAVESLTEISAQAAENVSGGYKISTSSLTLQVQQLPSFRLPKFAVACQVSAVPT